MLHPDRQVHYPCSDGETVADKRVDYIQMRDVQFALSRWFANDPAVDVQANLLVYYVEGNPRKMVAPDVFMARVPKQLQREVYKIWEEGRPPDVTFEFQTRSSRHLDPKFKVPLYDRLGVQEVYLFDPEGKWCKPRFQALRRIDGSLQKLDAIGPVFSPILGLELRVVGDWLRLYDPATGRPLPTPDEVAEQADQVTARVRDLELELERLRQQLPPEQH